MNPLGLGNLVTWIKTWRRDRTGRRGGGVGNGVAACVGGLQAWVTLASCLAFYGRRHVSLTSVMPWMRLFAGL